MLRALLAILALHRLALGIAAALIIVYSLVGFLWVPHLLRTGAQSYVADELGRSLALGKISFNPFTFRLSVRDARLSEKTGDDIAGFAELVVNAELASIWQRAVVLKEVRLDAPDVNLVVGRDGAINLAQLAPPRAPEPAADEPAEPLPRIRIGRLAVDGGRVDFEDRTRPAPFVATLSPIRFALDDFRTDLNHENAYDFSARSSAGESLDWSGNFTAQPLGSSGRFAVGQLRAQTIDSYLQGQLPVQLSRRRAVARWNVSVVAAPSARARRRVARDSCRQLHYEGTCGGGNAGDGSGAQGAHHRHAALFSSHSLRIDKIELSGAQVRASREADGSLSIARLMKAGTVVPAAAGEPPPPAEPSSPSKPSWSWAVGEFQLADAAVELEDRAVAPATQFNLAPVALNVAGLSSEPKAKVKLTADIGMGGDAAAEDRGRGPAQSRSQPRSRSISMRFDLSMLQAVRRASDEPGAAVGQAERQG